MGEAKSIMWSAEGFSAFGNFAITTIISETVFCPIPLVDLNSETREFRALHTHFGGLFVEPLRPVSWRPIDMPAADASFMMKSSSLDGLPAHSQHRSASERVFECSAEREIARSRIPVL